MGQIFRGIGGRGRNGLPGEPAHGQGGAVRGEHETASLGVAISVPVRKQSGGEIPSIERVYSIEISVLVKNYLADARSIYISYDQMYCDFPGTLGIILRRSGFGGYRA